MRFYRSILLLVSVCYCFSAAAQTPVDSVKLNKEYTSIDEALKAPEQVYRLNLSNQTIQFPDTVWSRFINLQYLSLKNDHIVQIPLAIGNITSLKVLDLSGNDFKLLPSSFINLVNLEELLLNDERYFNFEENIPLLSKLPSLKILHVENDGLETLPKNISSLIHLESLYLNNNRFKQIPLELNNIKNLRFVDFHDNKYTLPPPGTFIQDHGIKIRF